MLILLDSSRLIKLELKLQMIIKPIKKLLSVWLLMLLA